MASIQLSDVYKSYGSTKVLHGISGEFSDGEFIVIVGPSGCGKSTLLRMIAGLETVTKGDVFIDSRRVNDLEPADRDIAMVFQNYALYPHMSVFDNMAYGLKIRKIASDDIQRRVEEAADILEIREYLKRKPRELSGGQRQRVAMGRAIVREPSVFLFDEPLSNLDAKLRVQMRLEIRALQRRLGVTSIYVTHDQVEAMTLGDRLMVLNDGYVEQFGSPIELYEDPASLFVAGFIGSPAMNFLQCQFESAGQVRLENGVKLSVEAVNAGDTSTVTLGIRPEHMEQSDNGALSIDVVLLEQLGANTLVHGILHGTEQALVVSLPGTQRLEPGTTLSFNVPALATHLFDPETGIRLRSS
jgi:sn-glycerol 3-phosphate transport system ATP-binding protein